MAFLVPVANWFTVGELKVDWAFRIDTLTSVMLVVVTTVSTIVHSLFDRLHARRPASAALLQPTCRSSPSPC